MFINTTVILKIICQLLNCVSCNLLWRNTFTIEKETRYILLPLILNYRFLDKPSVAMEIAGSNLKQMKGSMGKGKGESLWPLTSHLPHTFYTGVYKILFNLQYWLVSFLSVLYEVNMCYLLSIGFCKPFNSHEWPRQNFSLQYLYNINQISDENKEKYQFGDN